MNRRPRFPCRFGAQARGRRALAARTPRRGAFLIVALICLVLATVLVGAMLTLAQTQRRQLSQQQLLLQTEWLMESAFERAASRLRDNSDYPGETWSISAAELGSTDSDDGAAGEAIIRVETSLHQPQHRIVSVEAVYPRESTPQVRRTRQTTVALTQEF
ncbi:MAG: hypothetical protein EXS05_05980 [Planctomycetaceae bacterium]|nr:hypothetical protein [Planctomycetaceae bacterium]